MSELVILSNFHSVAEMVECGDISRNTGGGQVREFTAANHINSVGDKVIEL